jgi:hypothetical protein
VRNSGSAPEAVFVDARGPSSAHITLASLYGPDTTVPFNVFENAPTYPVPTRTTAFTGTASTAGSTPIEFDIRPVCG